MVKDPSFVGADMNHRVSDRSEKNGTGYVDRYLVPWNNPRNEVGFHVGRSFSTLRTRLKRRRDFIYRYSERNEAQDS